ncbi:hypothetical protein PT144_01815 [Borreliella garinii]|nr:hypothetical protein [Borreliella garinii]WRM48539.1 hypothetical protein PT144_01815 [Borreliella garinii]
MKISVIGAGAWGTAIAKSLADKFDFNIFLWSFEEDVKNGINNGNVNDKYLKGINCQKIWLQVQICLKLYRCLIIF